MLIDNLAKLNRSSRIVVSAAMIVIAAIAMYNWAVAPYANGLVAAHRCESIAGNILKKNEVLSSKVGVKRNKLQQLQGQFAQLQEALFTPEQAKEFFSDLQSVSEEAGCAFYSFNILTSEQASKRRQAKDSSHIVPQSATLTVTGVYERIIRLVERLQVRAQKVWIDSIKLEIFDYDSAHPKCDITVTIYTIEDKEAGV